MFLNVPPKKGITQMKKTLTAAIISLSILLLSACSSGVLQEDYDLLTAENESLKSENQSLLNQYNELLDSHSAQLMEQTSYTAAASWATTSFGDNSLCLADDTNKYFQCISGNTYSISSDGISALWSDLLTSIKTLAYVNEIIQYETISIKFLDPSGIYILDVTLDMSGNSDMLNAVMCNIMYSDIIISALTETTSN